MRLAPSGALGDLGSLVLGDHPLELDHQLVLGRPGSRPLHEPDLGAGPGELVDEKGLVGVAPGQAVGRVAEDDVDGSLGGEVPVDLPRQVLFLYENDMLSTILPVSSGTGKRFCAKGDCGVAVTPAGAFRVDYWGPRWRESRLGRLYNPVHIFPREGVAIHGFAEVPHQPASHGCVRIPMSAAEWLPGKVPKGTPVYVIDGHTPVAPLAPGDPGAAGP